MSFSRRMRVTPPLSVFCFALCLSVATAALTEVPLPIVPLPSKAVLGSGRLVVEHGVRFAYDGYRDDRLERAQERFTATLAREMGIAAVPGVPDQAATLVIQAAGASKVVQQLEEDESYHLEVKTTGARLSAPNPLGILHGLQTFLQLVHATPDGFAVEAVTIDDKPRFAWRGLMIDTGRHFMPLEVIRANLDGMEAVKMNVFHWHLSEDQGFRIESKLFPLLQEKGSDGLFYTQDQVREIVAYARDRGIRVIPEFDMPGHATAWFVGYPDLASGKGPYRIERKWGVFDPVMDPTRESTYEFLDAFIGEMVALFPDAYFHIGGDECTGKEWDANPRIKQYMRAHHIADDAALQAYFTGRVQKLVSGHHKATVGWDEILQPDTPKDVVIQSWRGQQSLADAARRGYRGILSAGYYLDLNQSAADHYAVDPVVRGTTRLSAAEEKNILGGEATIFSEYVTPETIDGRIWPRGAAIAERLWSEQSVIEVASMYERINAFSQKLAYYHLPIQGASEQMFRRLSDGSNLDALRVLASVMQPPRDYVRETLKSYDVFYPLNRLVDAVPPESDTARSFNDLAGKIVSGKADTEDWEKARAWLTLWRDNDAVLQPTLGKSALTEELVPVSRNLAQAARIGLAALDQLQKDEAVDAKTQTQQLDALKELEKPQAVLLDKIVPGVEVLVRGSGRS